MRNLVQRFLFNKGDEEFSVDHTHSHRFLLSIEGLNIGELSYSNGLWKFRYSEDFRKQDTYRRLTGFSDLNKEYESNELWPFFKIRIPGLKQPMIQEILKDEQIDQKNEAELLKRFGTRTMTNPYVLVSA